MKITELKCMRKDILERESKEQEKGMRKDILERESKEQDKRYEKRHFRTREKISL